VLPIYEFTAQVAMLQPPPPALRRVLAAAEGNQTAMDGFARVNSGVTSPAEFFSETNVRRILSAAGETGAGEAGPIGHPDGARPG